VRSAETCPAKAFQSGSTREGEAHLLALPEAEEKEAWNAPTFRVKKKMFASYSHHGEGRGDLAQCATRNSDDPRRVEPDRFHPPYAGVYGWIGVYLDRNSDAEIAFMSAGPIAWSHRESCRLFSNRAPAAAGR
jgi:hypothetical protein